MAVLVGCDTGVSPVLRIAGTGETPVSRASSPAFELLQPFLSKRGFFLVFVLGDDLGVLPLGLIGLLELFEGAAGFKQRSGRPGGILVDVFHRQQRRDGFLELAFGQVGLADLELGAGGGFAVGQGDRLLVLLAGRVVLLLVFQRPADPEVAAEELVAGRILLEEILVRAGGGVVLVLLGL